MKSNIRAKEVSELIKILSVNDYNSFLRFYSFNDIQKTRVKDRIAQKIINILRNHNIKDNEDLQIKISNKSKPTTLKIIGRIEEKLFDYFLTNEFVQKQSNFSIISQRILKSQKDILVSQILQGKGFRSKSIQVLDKVIKQSEKFEMFGQLREALKLKKHFTVSEKTNDAKQKLDFQIELANQLQNNLETAIETSNTLTFLTEKYTDFSTKKNLVRDLIHNKILPIENSNSKTTRYFILIAKKTLIDVEENFLDSLKTVEEIKLLVTKNPHLFFKYRLAQVYLMEAELNYYLLNWAKCLKSCHLSMKYYNSRNQNYLVVSELLIKCSIFHGSIGYGKDFTHNILNNFPKVNTPLYKMKYMLYSSVFEFMEYNFNGSISILLKIEEVFEDKESWNLTIRTFLILNFIELKKFELADNHIHNLKKHIERNRRKMQLRKRDLLIQRLLRDLASSGFNFKMTFNKRQTEFALLASDHADYRWKINSSELIMFHRWFNSKLNNTHYTSGFEV